MREQIPGESEWLSDDAGSDNRRGNSLHSPDFDLETMTLTKATPPFTSLSDYRHQHPAAKNELFTSWITGPAIFGDTRMHHIRQSDLPG
jgi:hypothetical protein